LEYLYYYFRQLAVHLLPLLLHYCQKERNKIFKRFVFFHMTWMLKPQNYLKQFQSKFTDQDTERFGEEFDI
jgi:hypothetical protein